MNTVAELADQGYAEKMVLAHDAACFIDWFSSGGRAAAVPNWNFTHISDDVLPRCASAASPRADHDDAGRQPPSLLRDDEMNAMIVEIPRTDNPFPRRKFRATSNGIPRFDDLPPTLLDVLRSHVEIRPDSEAVAEVGGDRLSYLTVLGRCRTGRRGASSRWTATW